MTAVQVYKNLGYNCSFISMIGSSESRVEYFILQVRHVKLKSLVTDHLIFKRWGGFYSDHLGYDLLQDKGDESNPITFRQYFANMTTKTGKYAGDQLFQAISRDSDPTTKLFMCFTHHKVEANQVLNGLPCILSEELLVNPNYYISISGIEQSTTGIWYKEKRTFADPNEIHNEEAAGGMLESTGIMELYIDQDPQAALKNKMLNSDEADLQKSHARSQGIDDETVTLTSRSRQIGR